MKISSFSRFIKAGTGILGVAAGMIAGAGLAQVGPFIAPPGPPVRIVSPANHQVFYTPVDIPIFTFTHAISDAAVEDSGTGIEFTNVEIYASNSAVFYDLGPAMRLDETTNLPLPFIDYSKWATVPLGARFHEVWCLVWSNAPDGPYALTAVATGRRLLIATVTNVVSAPVYITNLPPNIGTNSLDVVNIAATDPIAVAGTNMSWVWPVWPGWTNLPPIYWTNWGPKMALFTVTRFGNASSNLTVNYKIGGSASNGVDYLPLPGYVKIPSGAAYGLIPIVPIDNGSNNVVKTVILKLEPATNSPAYVIGVPPSAEALIFYRWPRVLPFLPPFGVFLPDGTYHLSASGPDGAWFCVQTSPDLINWTAICTNQVVQGSVDVNDPNASGNTAGFYQLVPLSGQ